MLREQEQGAELPGEEHRPWGHFTDEATETQRH